MFRLTVINYIFSFLANIGLGAYKQSKNVKLDGKEKERNNSQVNTVVASMQMVWIGSTISIQLYGKLSLP